MGRFAKVLGLDRPRQLWEVATRGAKLPDGRWFVARFMSAAGTVAERWAPTRLRTPFFGRSVATWLLAFLWLGMPIVVLALLLPGMR